MERRAARPLRPLRPALQRQPAHPSCSNTTPTPPPRCSKPPSSSGTGCKDVYPDADQFNSLHEKLIAKWKDVASYLSKARLLRQRRLPRRPAHRRLPPRHRRAGRPQHRATAHGGHRLERAPPMLRRPRPAGARHQVHLQALPLGDDARRRVRHAGLRTYKDMRWIEPIWKMLLSNKGILPILWELYPNHELLLESHFVGANGPAGSPAPRLGPQTHALARRRRTSSWSASTAQARNPRPLRQPHAHRPAPRPADHLPRRRQAAGRWPVLGLWMIDQECCGMGIREDAGPITGNLCSFVPHFFR